MRPTAIFLAGMLVLYATLASAQNNASSNQQQQAAANHDSKTSQSDQKPTAEKDEKAEGHHYHVRMGGISVGGSYASGPFFSPFWSGGYYPYAFYSSPFFYYDPYWGFYGPGFFNYENGKGQVKLTGAPKKAEVYLDNAYAGTVDHLKEIWLDPGVYDLSISTPDGSWFRQRIYVLSGKSLKVTAKLALPKHTSEKSEAKP